jgi:hypothetical protein
MRIRVHSQSGTAIIRQGCVEVALPDPVGRPGVFIRIRPVQLPRVGFPQCPRRGAFFPFNRIPMRSEIIEFLEALPLHDTKRAILEVLKNPQPRKLAERIPYPSRYADRRTTLCQIRRRHLDHIDSMARSDETLNDLYAKLLGNYEHFYGRLRRRRRDEVPSDHFRKQIIVRIILDQVDARRAELQVDST